MHHPEGSNETVSDSTTPLPPLPRPPSPSADKGILANIDDLPSGLRPAPEADTFDVFLLKPLAALKMLCDSVENLVKTIGDVPPTPPISQPSTPQLGSAEACKDNIPRYGKENEFQKSAPGAVDEDGVPARAKTPIGSPEAHPTEPLQVIGAKMEPLNVQHGAIARKFYSKKPPPISLQEYLLRLHKFCPMSVAVYLATSLYIHKLAVIERTVPVTARNVHRLVLAGLRVAMKALGMSLLSFIVFFVLCAFSAKCKASLLRNYYEDVFNSFDCEM